MPTLIYYSLASLKNERQGEENGPKMFIKYLKTEEIYAENEFNL